jgi:hypothetical protein
MCNNFRFENRSVTVMLTNDGLMSTNASLVLMNRLRDRGRVTWLVSMNAAFVLMNDAFVRMSDALVRMNASFVSTKRAAGYRLQGTECALQPAVREVFNQLRNEDPGILSKMLWGTGC